MPRLNPFDGKEAYTKFAWASYSRLMGRGWFSLADIMADYLKLKDSSELPCLVSKCDKYGELKKAFRDIVHLLEERIGEGCVESGGNNRNKRFRYVGTDDNPLEDLQNSTAIRDIRTYAQFCEDSAGFFPRVWLDYFFEDTLDLLKITRRRKDGEQMISSSIDRELTNLHLLPVLYEAIRDKRVLNIQYRPYEEESVSLTFHPHLLKEHNGRWFLFGHASNKKPEFGYNLALDRIEGEPEILPLSEKYVPAPKGFYNEFFRDIVGVSHLKDSKPFPVTIRATNYGVFKLTETKKIHHSQNTIKEFGIYEDGEYGEFSLYVETNKEFIGRILQMGDGLVVISPPEVRNMFRESVLKLVDLYRN